MARDIDDLRGRAVAGALIAVRVTPKAARARLQDGDPVRIYVTTVPEAGKATDAARRLLAKALGVAPSRLSLTRGETSRDKVFVLDQGLGRR